DSILSVDRTMSLLWDELISFNPILYFFGDHGEGFGEHGFYSHARELYNESIHVPLLILNSDDEYTCEEPVSLLALRDMILDGVAPSSVGSGDEPVNSVVYDDDEKELRIATFIDQYKQIWSSHTREIYNVQTDPDELEKISPRNLHPELLDSFDSEINSLLTQKEKLHIKRFGLNWKKDSEL
ncbi:MAG: sulfatase-like hydrolase/transferase, partial [Halobacteriaceae archaeon]